MLNTIQQKLALSKKGAKDFIKGTIFTTLLNIALMLPAVFIFIFLEEYLTKVLNPVASITHGYGFYIILGVAFMIIVFIIAMIQYKSTYTGQGRQNSRKSRRHR